MIRLHATRKLFERLPLNGEGQLPPTARSQWLFDVPPLHNNPLGDWHGNLLNLQRRYCVLLVHDQTRFTVFLPALKKADLVELNDRFVAAFMNTLLRCGAEEHHMDAARSYLRPLQIDTRCDRSVQGTLNQTALEIKHALAYDRISIAEITGYRLGAWLADTPRTAKGRGHLWPNKEMLALLSTSTPN